MPVEANPTDPSAPTNPTASAPAAAPPAAPHGVTFLRMQAVYESILQRILAVPDDKLEPLNLDIAESFATISGALPKIRAHHEVMSKLPDFDITKVEQLEENALACLYVDSRHRGAMMPPAEIPQLVEILSTFRAQAAHDIAGLALRGLLDDGPIAALKRPYSHVDMGHQTIIIGAYLLDNWSKIEGKTAMTRQEIEGAMDRGQQLLVAVAVASRSPPGAQPSGSSGVIKYTDT